MKVLICPCIAVSTVDPRSACLSAQMLNDMLNCMTTRFTQSVAVLSHVHSTQWRIDPSGH